MIMRILYSIGIWFFGLGVRIAALLGHPNARLMVDGWKSTFDKVRCKDQRPTVWFHAASLGEFEQARPVLERYRELHPEHRVIVSFFSPSGYEIRKNYALADTVCYLPIDTPGNARRFIDAMQPSVVFFVKYEFWFNYLNELHRHGTPTYIFSAIFRPGQYFFRPWGCWFRKQLRCCFNHLFVQNEESAQLLRKHKITQVSIAGDTRFDRVHQIAQTAATNDIAEQFVGTGNRVIIAGSSWEPDEQNIASYLHNTTLPLKLILAPHVISEEHLSQIEKIFPESIRYSKFQSQNNKDKTYKVLIIDNIGMLSQLYRYADVAYIGGGFGRGIHNILEAVTFGKPVVFGPNHTKFQEAIDIIACGGGWTYTASNELCSIFDPLLTNPQAMQAASEQCRMYMEKNLGSTEKILKTIEK